MNTKAVTNIQRQIDILSDGHQVVVDQAVVVTAAIIAMDDHLDKLGLGALISVCTPRVQRQLDKLQNQLRGQAARALRVCDEVEQIKISMKIV